MCPRCGRGLKQYSLVDYPHCLICGYEDYTYIPPVKAESNGLLRKGAFNSAVTYIIRYSGSSKYLQDVTCVIKGVMPVAGRSHSRMHWLVVCPFCDGEMILMDQNNKGKRARDTYECGLRHKVYLIQSEGVSTTWR